MKQQNRLSQTELSDRELKNRQMASVISILVGVFAISLGVLSCTKQASVDQGDVCDPDPIGIRDRTSH